ncbi:cytochrome P450 [Aspergillus pseudonomiae]|uniref:Cytochrome P450 n=1 Tax=Aspergillus pseudonomiae TaxID=1506151 RepID=A0A5N7DDK5_9EURO|nr:cytochrome P450 [Aspergillus pseudonomiae]KAE8404447.1 cytochrome P450 [Aspergillus pseudonomiae]
MEYPTWALTVTKFDYKSVVGLLLTFTVAVVTTKILHVFTKRCPGIPSIPLYISVYDAYRRVSEIGFHNTRLRPVLETHGAVNIWNSGQWAVLVTKPEYVVRILRNERVVAKGGFYGKVPHSTLAGLFGENIIDSDGELWKQFTGIMKPGIQRAHNISALKIASCRLIATFKREQQQAPSDRGVVINDIIERWAIDVFGDSFFDVDFGALNGGTVRAQDALLAILWNLGGHLIHLFPVLERIGWPLRPARPYCFSMIRELEEALIDVTEKLTSTETPSGRSEKLIYRLKRARDNGLMSDFHYRSNLKMLFFAGHENVKFALIATLWELSQNPQIQDKLYQEITAHSPSSSDEDDLKTLPYLTAVLAETLRLYPPVSQLINRKTLEPVYLGNGITIPQGTWVGWTAYGVHTDPNTWGLTAHEYRPERWGDDVHAIQRTISQQQVRGSYIPFNAWTRSCIGSEFALLQLRVTLYEIVRHFEITHAPEYHYSIKENASLEPYNCRLIFKDRI